MHSSEYSTLPEPQPQSSTKLQENLVYSCVCSNGQVPNASEYSQTIPYYQCTTAANNCVDNCPRADSACQAACRSRNPCGAQNPTRVNTSTISTMAATSTGGSSATADSTATGQFTGFGDSASSTGTSDTENQAQALAIGFGRSYGLIMVLAGVCGGFIFML